MIGGFLFVSGILLYTGIRIAAVLYMKELTGWSTPPGRYGTALEQIGAKKDIVVSLKNNSLIWFCLPAAKE